MILTVPPICSQSWSLLIYSWTSDLVTNLILAMACALNQVLIIFHAAAIRNHSSGFTY